MHKRKLTVLWGSIFALMAAISFPPYGYDRLTSSYIPPAKLGYALPDKKTENVPWKYVGHSFILSPPPFDRELDRISAEVAKSFGGTDVGIMTYTPHIKIGWHILVVEIVAIFLIILGALFTIRVRDK